MNEFFVLKILPDGAVKWAKLSGYFYKSPFFLLVAGALATSRLMRLSGFFGQFRFYAAPLPLIIGRICYIWIDK
jgi:hypothetical protein